MTVPSVHKRAVHVGARPGDQAVHQYRDGGVRLVGRTVICALTVSASQQWSRQSDITLSVRLT